VRSFRVVLIVVNFVLVALLVVFQNVRGNELRYEVARRQGEVKRLALENRALTLDTSEARRPDALNRRAAALQLDLKGLEPGAIVNLSEKKQAPVEVAKGPKRPRP
jgi:hypothetical protein